MTGSEHARDSAQPHGDKAGNFAKVVNGDFCSGCGGCGVATSGAVPITLSDRGMFKPLLDNITPDQAATAAAACPFSDETPNEDQVAAEFFEDLRERDARIGRYADLFAGRVTDENQIVGSSSGGLTTWIACALLERGLVDGVIHTGSAGPSSDMLIEYKISNSPEQVLGNRKSSYYPTSFADVLNSIPADSSARYAFVGLPCQVTAVRHLQLREARWAQRIVYTIGIVCGHLKSVNYARSIGWQLGIKPADLAAIDFRVKNPRRSARGYGLSVQDRDGHVVHSEANLLVGGNWGHASFQPNACNYCDDIFAETADICFGDAWLPKYESDWRGTNVVVSRRRELSELLQRGAADGDVYLEELSAASVAETQAGNFRHRRIGLTVRMADDRADGMWTPTKRVSSDIGLVDAGRIPQVRSRRQLGDASHRLFEQAIAEDDLSVYTEGIKPYVERHESHASVSRLRTLSPRLRRRLWKYRSALTSKAFRYLKKH